MNEDAAHAIYEELHDIKLSLDVVAKCLQRIVYEKYGEKIE